MNNNIANQSNMTGQSQVPTVASGDGHVAGNPVQQNVDTGVEQKIEEVKDSAGNVKGTIVVDQEADRAT